MQWYYYFIVLTLGEMQHGGQKSFMRIGDFSQLLVVKWAGPAVQAKLREVNFMQMRCKANWCPPTRMHIPPTMKHYPCSLVPRICSGGDSHCALTGKCLIYPKHNSADVFAVLFRYIKAAAEIVKSKTLFWAQCVSLVDSDPFYTQTFLSGTFTFCGKTSDLSPNGCRFVYVL